MDFSSYQAVLYKKNEKYPNVFAESQEDIFKSITGLESSAGAVIVSPTKSAVFVDGRYTLAAKQHVDSSVFDILNLQDTKIIKWIEKNLPEHSNIACDYEYCTHSEMDFFINKLRNYKIVQLDLKKTLHIPPAAQFEPQIYYFNESKDKLIHLTQIINQYGLDGYLVCDPCSIAWLLNIRDLNRKHTPVMLGYLLATKDYGNFLYLDDRYGSVKKFKSERDLPKDMSKLSKIGIDKSQTPFFLQHRNFIDIKNPCTYPKSMKSQVEIGDMKLAARKDSVAIINFLHWFYNNTKKITELDVVEKLLYFRKQQSSFIGESFKSIAAADENAAIIHYHPSVKTNKIIDNILLIDSGGQYKHGTTDITRTVSVIEPSKEQRLFYTMVLKGHIALADAKFPVGTTGAQLDTLARQFLWRYSKDFNHSTGHGIGYMSHVHEGPAGIARNNNMPLQPGMILSNEPGYYQEGGFGIRLENMMLVKEYETSGCLLFETISLVPFDAKFISKEFLTTNEINWLKKYNQKIVSFLKLHDAVSRWLFEYYLDDLI